MAELRKAKRVLHTSVPKELPCRGGQIEEVYNFLSSHLASKSPGSMYISGAPGTGKTAVVNFVLRRLREEAEEEVVEAVTKKENRNSTQFHQLTINCMAHNTEGKVVEGIYKGLVDNKFIAKKKGDIVRERVLNKFLPKTRHPKAKMTILVLDEIDQLVSSKTSETLQAIFEATTNPRGTVIIIGIANALDLTVKHFPILSGTSTASPKPKKGVNSTKNLASFRFRPEGCQLLSFPAYEKAEIETILLQRLKESEIFNPTALKFVAAKVAASSGDMRKALHGCQMALEDVVQEERKSKRINDDSNSPPESTSSKRICSKSNPIGIQSVAKIFSHKKDTGQLPLQQKIILSTLLRVHSRAPPSSKAPPIDGVKSSIPLGVLYEEYRKVTTAQGAPWIQRSEMLEICSLLEARGLLNIVEEKVGGGGGGLKKFGGICTLNKGIYFDPRGTEKAIGSNEFIQAILAIK